MRLRRRFVRGAGQAVYHRLEGPTQTPETAAEQVRSNEIWGRPGFGSTTPKVKAYVGELPDGARGIAFVTNAQPDPNTPPGRAYWSPGRSGVRMEGDVVKIDVTVIRNTQV